MCGIAGILGPSASETEMAIRLSAMADALKHRGPDASGTWSDAPAGVGLAHRRLSILDLSVMGNQPMVSENGRFVISYNGEVYNHRELPKELEKTRTLPWRGRSDTEVLLTAIERWGVRASLERINGMFAFAVWDRQERKLTLARDRKGEKPLYEYIPLKSSLLFFLDKLVEGIGDFEAGPGGTTLSLTPKATIREDGTSVPSRPLKFGVAICYEVIFPDLVRQLAINGADFLVTITNDGWFGNSSAPAQHFSMVVFRSVENHLAFARSANTGITGAIDPYGRILHATGLFTEESVQATIPVWQPHTFYSRYGDVFAYGCVVICALLCLISLLRPKEPVHGKTAITPV